MKKRELLRCNVPARGMALVLIHDPDKNHPYIVAERRGRIRSNAKFFDTLPRAMTELHNRTVLITAELSGEKHKSP